MGRGKGRERRGWGREGQGCQEGEICQMFRDFAFSLPDDGSVLALSFPFSSASFPVSFSFLIPTARRLPIDPRVRQLRLWKVG